MSENQQEDPNQSDKSFLVSSLGISTLNAGIGFLATCSDGLMSNGMNPDNWTQLINSVTNLENALKAAGATDFSGLGAILKEFKTLGQESIDENPENQEDNIVPGEQQVMPGENEYISDLSTSGDTSDLSNAMQQMSDPGIQDTISSAAAATTAVGSTDDYTAPEPPAYPPGYSKITEQGMGV